MNEILVSIIIPFFNAAAHFRDTLHSIQSQRFQNWECICVDDGSTDSSFHIASTMALSDQRFKIYTRPVQLPKGGNSCRNYGFEQARGQFIQWFDADDLMRPGMIERKAIELKADPALDFVVSKVADLIDGEVICKKYEMDSDNRIVDFLQYKIHFLTPGPMFRRSFLMGRPLFSVLLKRHQEWEFFSRLLIEGCSYRVLPVYCSIRIIHSESINATHQKKTLLERAYVKLYTVDVLNKNTQDKAVAVLYRIYHRYMLWSIFQSLVKFKFKELQFFTRIFVEFSFKSLKLYRYRQQKTPN
ncbi:glycosyltransferase family 2 protein [Pedobacter immunditicola]|uniref:glycosyltransferase family 2 protein n=1 Tax=Pedobacter immunditicola TaxID=3133440 RepID=UPI00309B3AAE